MDKVFIAIDGNSLIHRAFWAIPPMTDPKGRNTNALYGFLGMLFNLIEKYNPDYIAVAFDKKGKTFRHEKYNEYKAGRRKTPQELNEQFDYLKDILFNIGIRYIEIDRFEADDILGAISDITGVYKYIVTGDRDSLQLIKDDCCVLLTKKGVTEVDEYDKQLLIDRFSIDPDQVVDLKALMGDSSDNIPGVYGIGEKTAIKLLQDYHDIENLYAHIDDLPQNKIKEKLINGKEDAILSKWLATINKELPNNQEIILEDYAFNGFDESNLLNVFDEYSFNSFKKRFDLHSKEIVEIKSISISPSDVKETINGCDALAVYIDDKLHFAKDENTEYIVDIKKSLIDAGVNPENIGSLFEDCISKDAELISFDVKDLMHKTELVPNKYFDCIIASWLLNPGSFSSNFIDLCEKYSLPVSAASLFHIKKELNRKIEQDKLNKPYYEIEIPLVRVLYEMENEGLYIDREALIGLGEKYKLKIDSLSEKIYDLAGRRFNILSTKQLGEVLFEDLGLPIIKKTKTGYSTDANTLSKLEGYHPIIEYIKEYRTLTKMNSTYVEGLLHSIKNNKIHTTFLQTATTTGRLSSIEPNLQNIPVKSELSADIRKLFYAPDGYYILSADYSQIELRILAHIANDKNLIDAFMKGQDIHKRTAAEIFGKSIDEVSDKERSNAKAINFGIVYGISDFGLAQNTGISVKRAKTYIEKYLNEFSGVKNYMNSIKEQAYRDGYVRTLFDRIRYLPELSNSNYNIRSFGERAALNTPIQGTAADIMKIAMIKVFNALKPYKTKAVLQIHDELILYVPEDEIDIISKLVKDCMMKAASLSVPLVVNTNYGKYWSEAK